MPVKMPRAYEEYIDFMVAKMTPREILDFKTSPEAQERVRDLIEKQSAGLLTAEEAEEIESIKQFERMFTLIKAKALKALRQP